MKGEKVEILRLKKLALENGEKKEEIVIMMKERSGCEER